MLTLILILLIYIIIFLYIKEPCKGSRMRKTRKKNVGGAVSSSFPKFTILLAAAPTSDKMFGVVLSQAECFLGIFDVTLAVQLRPCGRVKHKLSLRQPDKLRFQA